MADKNSRTITRERDAEGMTLAEQARAKAVVQQKLLGIRGALKVVASGIDVPPGVAIQPNTSDILALERSVQEFKLAAGVA